MKFELKIGIIGSKNEERPDCKNCLLRTRCKLEDVLLCPLYTFAKDRTIKLTEEQEDYFLKELDEGILAVTVAETGLLKAVTAMIKLHKDITGEDFDICEFADKLDMDKETREQIEEIVGND